MAGDHRTGYKRTGIECGGVKGMNKSVRKFYGHHRFFDYEDFDTVKGRRVVKRRAHKRLRGRWRRKYSPNT